MDLVLCGHDHDYERTYTVHGTDPGTALRPTVVSTSLTDLDANHTPAATGRCRIPPPSCSTVSR